MSLKYPLDAAQLVALFNRAFEATDNTVLQGGADEPYYVPGQPSCIYFRADYARSALHEVAHWCVAGVRRRRFPDYGYWYSPDGAMQRSRRHFLRWRRGRRRLKRPFVRPVGSTFRRASTTWGQIFRLSSSSLLRCASQTGLKYFVTGGYLPVRRGF